MDRRSLLLGFSIAALAVLASPVCRGQDAQNEPGEPPLTLPQKDTDLPEPQNDPKAVEVVERYLQALGGRPLLGAINDRTFAFDTVKHAPTGETKAELKQFIKKGFRVREEWNIPGFAIKDQKLKFVQVYNGLDGWVQMFGTVSPLEGKTLSIFVWDKPLGDFFATWKEDGYSLQYYNEGKLDLRGKDDFASAEEPVDIVQSTDFTGQSRVRYYFAKSTGLLLKKEWREQGKGGYVKKEDYYLRYRDIPFSDDPAKKVKFSLHHKIFEDGNMDTERVYSEVTINTGIPDAIFARPEGIDFEEAKRDGKLPARFGEGEEGKGGEATAVPKPVPVPVPVSVPVQGAPGGTTKPEEKKP
jgi:hypothetical protein